MLFTSKELLLADEYLKTKNSSWDLSQIMNYEFLMLNEKVA